MIARPDEFLERELQPEIGHLTNVGFRDTMIARAAVLVGCEALESESAHRLNVVEPRPVIDHLHELGRVQPPRLGSGSRWARVRLT